MADQDVEMEDAIAGADTMDETPAADLTTIINTGMQQLAIEEDTLKAIILPKGRLKVGGDFGGSKSTIGWGWAAGSKEFLYCSDPEEFLEDSEQNDRIPSVAAVISSTQCDNPAHLELIFGSVAARLQAGADDQLPVKVEMLKFGLLTTSFLGSHSTSCDELRRSIQDAKLSALEAIREQSASKVYIQDPLTAARNLHTILSSSCITREYLRYLLQTLKAAVMTQYDLTIPNVEELFSHYVDVAMSLPAIANEAARAAFRKILIEAGFPSATLILNEAKSAALYHVWKKGRNFSGIQNLMEHLYVLDIGALTWEAYLLTIIFTAPKVELEARGKAAGGFNGSQSWNYLFSRHVEHILEDNVSQMSDLLPDFGENIDVSRRVLAAAIQPVKEIFSINGVSREYKIKPQPNGTQMDDVEYDQFSTYETNFYARASLLKDVSENWGRPFMKSVRSHIKELRKTLSSSQLEPGAKIVVGLTGWGSLPPFVLEQFQGGLSTMENVEVTRLETRTNSVVARGNYLTLLDQSIAKTMMRDF